MPLWNWDAVSIMMALILILKVYFRLTSLKVFLKTVCNGI